MGSKVAVWKLVEPVGPCDSVRKYTSRRLKGVDIHKLREEIASVGARVNSIDEQIDIIKAALPELENKIRYACLGMPMSSFPLDELQNLQAIHFKLLQFWEDLSRKQLEKLGCLSDCLQILEEQKGSNKSGLPEGLDNYKEIGQHVSEKVQSDIRKNHELEVKLCFDRISCLPTKSSKPSSRVYSNLRFLIFTRYQLLQLLVCTGYHVLQHLIDGFHLLHVQLISRVQVCTVARRVLQLLRLQYLKILVSATPSRFRDKPFQSWISLLDTGIHIA